MLGTSYYVVPDWRVYGEFEYAFHYSDGAEQVNLQFGTEISPAGPTGCWAPFFAVNCESRQDVDFGGYVNTQAGWLRRNVLDQTLRLGFQYYHGKAASTSSSSRMSSSWGWRCGMTSKGCGLRINQVESAGLLQRLRRDRNAEHSAPGSAGGSHYLRLRATKTPGRAGG